MFTFTVPDDRPFELKCEEFWFHVYNPAQEALTLTGVDREASLGSPTITKLLEELPSGDLADAAVEQASVELLAKYLGEATGFLDEVRLLIGKTDTKLRFDLSLLLRDTPGRTDGIGFCGCAKTAFTPHSLSRIDTLLKGSGLPHDIVYEARCVVAKYLLGSGLASVIPAFKELSKEHREAVLTTSILPHDNRQSEAKRGGHTYEAEIARVLVEAGLTINPEDKATNPIAGDATFNGRSFDVLVHNKKKVVKLAIISLVHTSNPGQYGVDKSEQTLRYREDRERWSHEKPADKHYEVWALVDGAGFGMNAKALKNIVTAADGFVQLDSLFKLLVRADQLGLLQVQEFFVERSDYPQDAVEALEAALPDATRRTEPFPEGTPKVVRAGAVTMRVA